MKDMKDVNECIKFLEEECIHNKSKEDFYVSTIQYLKGFILLNKAMKESVEQLGEMINTYKNKFLEDEDSSKEKKSSLNSYTVIREILDDEISLSEEELKKIVEVLEKKL